MNQTSRWIFSCLVGCLLVAVTAEAQQQQPPSVRDRKAGGKGNAGNFGNSTVPLADLLKMPNLIPNADLSDKENPLKGWRCEYPGEDFYVDNAKYLSASNQGGVKCVQIEQPYSVGSNQGTKIETPFVKCEPGATYVAVVDCMTFESDLSKLFVEVYTIDPTPDVKRNTINAVRAGNGLPALYKCYRADFDNLKMPGMSKKWTTMTREFTILEKVKVMGEVQKPAYMAIKALALSTNYKAQGNFKAYFSNFRLVKVEKTEKTEKK